MGDHGRERESMRKIPKNEGQRHKWILEGEKIDEAWLITKDMEGKRIFDPGLNKENVANYYEDLYSRKPYKHQPYHEEVKETVERLANNAEEGVSEMTKSQLKRK